MPVAISIKRILRPFIIVCLHSPFVGLTAVAQQSDREDPFTFNTSVTGDFVRNFRGGLQKGNTYIGIETVSLGFDTEKGGLWKGGNFQLKGLNSHGNGPSASLTGDLQVLSNIEAGDFSGLYEFWYQHVAGKFTFLVGVHDLNSEFAGTKYGGTFINSSFGVVPNLSLNNPVSIYPVTAPAAFIKYTASDALELKYAIYDGDPGEFETNRFNIDWSIDHRQGFLNIAEADYYLIQREKVTGTYKLGMYSHTGSFRSYSDTLSFSPYNYGFYFIADQALFSRRLSAARGLCFFIQGGWAPEKINMVNWYFGAGLRYHGIIPYRHYDELGIAVAKVFFGKSYLKGLQEDAGDETAIEMTYRFQFSHRYSIQPSLQYIINPGGNTGRADCLAGLLRFTLKY